MDIKTIDMLAMVRVDCSYWSARAKIRPEDLSDDVVRAMPPEQVATLGSKRLFDPLKLKIFSTLKARAHSALDKKCVKFLGGWATHTDRLHELGQQLADVASEFDAATTNFLSNYEDGVKNWAANFPGWENMLFNSVPTMGELRKKFNFSWQAYQIQPVNGMSGFTGNDLKDSLGSLEQNVLEEVAKDIKTIYRECFADKSVVTKKAFRPLRTLIDKVRSLSFIHPYLIYLESVLVEVLDAGERSATDSTTIKMVKSFLTSLSTQHGVRAVCEQYDTNRGTAVDALDAFWAVAQTAQPVQPVQPVEYVQLEELPVTPVQQKPEVQDDLLNRAKAFIRKQEAKQSNTVMDSNYGLW